MATFLDVTGLAAFSKIFVFLIVLLIVYVIFSASKWFSGNTWIAWIIALVVAIFVILSDLASGIIQHVTPWFAVLIVFVIFLGMASKVFGGNVNFLGQYAWALYILVALVFIIGTLAYIRAEVNVPGDVDEDGNEIKEDSYLTTSNFIFHPKIMGIIFILLVAVFTVALLAGKT